MVDTPTGAMAGTRTEGTDTTTIQARLWVALCSVLVSVLCWGERSSRRHPSCMHRRLLTTTITGEPPTTPIHTQRRRLSITASDRFASLHTAAESGARNAVTIENTHGPNSSRGHAVVAGCRSGTDHGIATETDHGAGTDADGPRRYPSSFSR